MSYNRVIPRDLFNEANLLKCLGQMELHLDTMNKPDVKLIYDHMPFDISQNPDDGSLTCLNIILMVGCIPHLMHRPLNSREPWPLYVTSDQEEDLWLFNNSGALSDEFLQYIQRVTG